MKQIVYTIKKPFYIKMQNKNLVSSSSLRTHTYVEKNTNTLSAASVRSTIK